MTFKTDDRIFETSITTGTGTYTLDGAQTGFQAFSVLSANNDCAYFATDDTNWEVGIGTVLTGPARLQRTAILASSNSDAAVDWGAGTRKIRCGLPAAMAIPRTMSKSVAGSADVTLTQNEQRRDQLVLTGALTGNINVIVDATPWRWSVYNNTSGAYTLKVKTSGGTGIFVPQGSRTVLECDGTNVVEAIPAATQAQQEAGTNTGAIVTPAVQQYHPSAAKGWILFNGSGTPAASASYNVSSITDVGGGQWKINWSTAMSSANYAAVASNTGFAYYMTILSRAAGYVELFCGNAAGTPSDDTAVSAVAFGDQ